MPLIPDPKNCDISVKRAIQGLSKKLGYTGSPTFTNTYITNVITASTSVFSKTCELAAGLNVLRVTGLQTDDTALTGTLRGAYIDVSNGSAVATGTIRALELKARTEAPGDTGSKVAVLEGLSISADSKAHDVTTMRAAEFILDGKTAGTIDEAVGLRIANNLQVDKATLSYGLQIYRDSFDYTYDISLSLGGHITGDSYVNQDLRTTASPTFAGLHINSAEVDSTTLLTLESDISNNNEYNEILFKVVGGQNYGAIRSCVGAIGGDSYMSFFTTTDSGTLVRQVTIQHNGKVGLGTYNPETLLTIVSAAPYLTLHNVTEEDTDGGGESRIIGKREDGAGTPTAAGQIEISHDGSGVNDRLGKYVVSVNTGAGLVQALEIGSDLLATFAGAITASNYTAANLLTACATNAGALDFSAASKTLTVEDNAVVSQDYSSDASPQFTGIELGHVSDTTITRVSAGVIAVEGVTVMMVGGAPTAHSIASHDDTTGTGAELNTLTDGSDAGALHSHAAAYQPLDDVLTDLAALTAVADNEFIVGTGAGTYAHESGVTVRTSLGLAIGTDVQAYHANLAAIAGGTWTGAASITTLGTIVTGVWEGTSIAVGYTDAKCVAVWPDTYTADQNLLEASSPTFANLTVTEATTPSIRLKHITNTSYNTLDFYEDTTLLGRFIAIGSNYVTALRRNNLELKTFVGDLILQRDQVGKVAIGVDTPNTLLTVEGTITLKEQAAADGDTATYGQTWVKNTAPCTPWFTDDTGNDGQFMMMRSASINANSDAADVQGCNVLWVDTSGSDVVLGGLANGVDNQLLYVFKYGEAGILTIEHQEGTGTQKFMLKSADLVYNGVGICLPFICKNGVWYIAAYPRDFSA